jgi:serine/threonine-protein kinase HipA
LAAKNWKLNIHDRMGLLLNSCSDCIGAAKVIPYENK